MTEDARPSPPEGWYPDPERADTLRWWDGNQWSLRKPMPTPTGTRKPVGRGFQRLSDVLLVTLGLVSVVMVGQFLLAIWGYTMIEDAASTGDLDALDAFDGMDIVLSVSVLLGVVVAGICWMTWQGLLARSAFPGELARGTGMHAFSWIIPVAALWLPFQNVRDLWRVNAARAKPGLLGWWWAGWLVCTVTDRVIARMYKSTDSVADFRALMVLQVVTSVVGLATAFLAIRIVRTLTAGGLERAAMEVNPVVPGAPPAAW